VWLAEQGWDVTGVDFSEVGLGKARALAAARGVEVAWVAADLRSYQPEEEAYDGYGGPQDPSILFSADHVADDLLGLGVQRAARVERRVDADEGERVALDTVVRAVRP
jgi:hypothetical protein